LSGREILRAGVADFVVVEQIAVHGAFYLF
jgi:hypothetical protein